MRNFRAPLNLSVWKVGKSYHFLNKVVGLSPDATFKWDSGKDTFLWILLSFSKQLFAEHLRRVVSVVYPEVLLFTMWRIARQWIPVKSVIMHFLISFKKKTPLTPRDVERLYMKQQPRSFVRQNIATSCIVFTDFFALFKLIWIICAWVVHIWIVNSWIVRCETVQPRNVF